MIKDTNDSLKVVEIKAFIPAKDFEVSKQFYSEIGFTKKSEGGGVAHFNKGSCSFLLQDFYQEALADNLMMHLLVEDVTAWHKKVRGLDLSSYGAKISEIIEQPWKMLDFIVTDPSGVLWRIGENVD